jgi:phospholipid/cholesterol/gamma-HCH transport system substrate-binding protein
VMKTNREVQDFARDARALLPTVERTLDEYRELAAEARRTMPVLRATLDDVGAAARNASRLLERADVMLQDNRENIEETIRNLNRASAGAARLFSEENVNNASRTITNTKTASESLPRIAASADDILSQGRFTVRKINELLPKIEASLNDFNRLTGPLGLRSDRISRNVDEAAIKLNEVLGDMRALMRAIDRSNGTLQKVLTDPSLYNNLDHAAAMITKLVPRLDTILKNFEVFADKLARHPERLGLPGVIRPDSGLKGPPTPQIQPKGPPVIMHAPLKPGER